MTRNSPLTSVWLLLTAVACLCVYTFGKYLGTTEEAGWYLAGPMTTLGGAALSVIGTWLVVGVVALARDRDWLRRETAVPWLVTTLTLVLYTNIIRERTMYGDVYDYVKAAMNLAHGEAFHPRYIYPPFLAVLLQPLTPLGATGLVYACIVLELLALLAFVVLTSLLLVRAGLGPNLAYLLVGLGVVANTPLLRNILYVQANLFVLDAVLVAILWFGRKTWLSALGLAVAIYLKMSPALLGVVFLMAWDFRWLVAIVGWMLALTAGVTRVGGELAWTSFLKNLSTMGDVSSEAFRDGSADALARHTVRLLDLPGSLEKGINYTLKGVWGLFGGLALWRLWERHEDAPELPTTRLVIDGVLLWLPLMTLLAPKVWEHHAIFVMPTLLVALTRLKGRQEQGWWLLAWVLIFWIPTFDVYLLSWHRVIGIQLGWLVAARVILRESPSPEILRFSTDLDQLLRPGPPDEIPLSSGPSLREPTL